MTQYWKGWVKKAFTMSNFSCNWKQEIISCGLFFSSLGPADNTAQLYFYSWVVRWAEYSWGLKYNQVLHPSSGNKSSGFPAWSSELGWLLPCTLTVYVWDGVWVHFHLGITNPPPVIIERQPSRTDYRVYYTVDNQVLSTWSCKMSNHTDP